MPLLDDTSHPDHAVYHKGNDRVSGIYYASPDVGYIVTQGDGETIGRGGAVFKATGSAVRAVAFSGDGTGLRLIGSIDFVGIEPTPTGYVALAYANDVIQSNDAGATFDIAHNGGPDAAGGIEAVLAYRITAGGTTMVRQTGAIMTSTTAPGPSASFATAWAPNAVPSVPDPVPADQCQDGPLGSTQPYTPYSVQVGADRRFIAYTANPDQHPEVCLSDDAGHSFTPHPLLVPASAADQRPSGVVFTSRMNGLAWYASRTAGSYVQRTTDGGATWADVSLPAGLTQFELPAGWFAPDGMHGWLAGFDYAADRALLLATTDAGSTWRKVDGVAEVVAAAGGDKLSAGFALDATHVWIGGEKGLLLHN